jgi:hypothetical protein
LPDDDCCVIHPPEALRAAKRKTSIVKPEIQNQKSFPADAARYAENSSPPDFYGNPTPLTHMMRLDAFSRQFCDEIGFRIVRTTSRGDWQFIELLPTLRGELPVVGCLLLQIGIVRPQPAPGSAARSLAAEPDIAFRNDAG